ncbi:MAG: hypothetical protein WC473_04565 [Patescibacteria group bacterium]
METNERRMAFLAHWVESWNWLLWPFSCLHKHPERRYWLFWLYPLCWLMSVRYLVGKKSFDTVDRFVFKTPTGEEIDGRTVLLRNFGWHFFLPTRRNSIKKRILEAVLDLQRKGVKVIGLGALTKDVRITDGGSGIVQELSDRLWARIVHGDTLTAATVIRQALALIEKYQIKGPVFLTGSTSKIGRAVAIDLARRGIKILMYTQDYERFTAIALEAGDASVNLEWTNSLTMGSSCVLWITGKSIPSRRDLFKHIPDDAVVLNFAVPNPLKKRDFRARPDIKHFEGGLLAYDPQQVNIHFTMRLKPGITYACHAGTFVHAFKEWQHHEVGPVDLGRLDEVWQAAEEIGFSLPPVN